MSDPSTDKKDEPEATAESSLEPLAVTSTHVFPNLREDQVISQIRSSGGSLW